MPGKDKLADIYVEIDARTEKLDREINRLKNKIDKDAQKMGKTFSQGFGKAIAFAGGAILINKFINFTKKSIELYFKQEAAEKRLTIAYRKNAQALIDYAAALQQKTAYGDEDIIEAEALIAAFIREEDSIKKLTKATLDLAAAKGMDLKTAADLLTKSVASGTNALSRYGLEIKGAAGSAERLESAVKAVNDAFGGQAAAQLDTYAGKVQAISNAWGDLREKFGRFSTKTIFAALQTLFSGREGTLAFASQLTSNEIAERAKKIADQVKQEYGVSMPNALKKTIVSVKTLEDEIKKLEERLKNISIYDTATRDKLLALIGSKQQIIQSFLHPKQPVPYTNFDDVGNKPVEPKFPNIVPKKLPFVTPNYYQPVDIATLLVLQWIRESDIKQQTLFNKMINNASRLGNALEDAFSGHGQTLVSYMNQALQIALNIADAIHKSTGSIGDILGIIASVIPGFGLINKIAGGGRAIGGAVYTDKVYTVGERGPELFIPNTPGIVVPNSAITTGASGGDINRSLQRVIKSIQAMNLNMDEKLHALVNATVSRELKTKLQGSDIVISEKRASRIMRRYQ